MQALQQFLTLDSDSLLQDPQWKRVEEEECVFHSISILRRTSAAAVPQDGLANVPSPQTSSASTSTTITKLGSSLISGMSYITGKVSGIHSMFIDPCIVVQNLPHSPDDRLTAVASLHNRQCFGLRVPSSPGRL